MANAPHSSSPIYLHSSDILGMILVSKIFEGSGFGGCKSSMLIKLLAKNKVGFLNGSIIPPDPDDPNFHQCERANEIVISWILNSL